MRGEKENAPGCDTGGEVNFHPSGKVAETPVGGDQKDLAHSTPDAVAFLQSWCAEGPWVLTSIPSEGGRTTTATFGPTDVPALSKWIEERQGHQNLYFMVNPPTRPLMSKAAKADVRGLYALHVDVDPRAGEDFEAERVRSEKILREFDPPPTVIIDSRGGFQGFWLLDAEVHIGGDEARAEELEAYNIEIAMLMQADACHNIDRIMRLPGTVNLPNERKRKKGRKVAIARVVEADWGRTYPLSKFTAAHRNTARKCDKGTTVAADPAPDVDVASLPVSDSVRDVITHGKDPGNPTRWPSRSEALFFVCCAMVRAGCPDDVILGTILDARNGISESVLDKKHRAERYARQQVANAREVVEDAFECDKDGKPLANSQRKIRLAVRRLGVTMRHDLFSERSQMEGLDGFGPAVDDAAMNRLWLRIDEEFGFRPSREFFWAVVPDAARRFAFHPVREYLAGLVWDGVQRLDGWLPAYGHAEDTPYVRAVGALVLVAAVRRVRHPGAKFDEMLVLESAQGTNKSSALRILAVRDEWFSDDLPLNADTQRVIEALAGKWVVEAGELKGLKKGGTDHLKGFLSRTFDRARPAYGRLAVEVPRQCVIVGTTNDSRYLRDTTGNRRFWPVAVQGFDLDALRRDRDQLWAEAAAREEQGAAVRLDPVLWADAAAVQDDRRVEDPFFETLHSALGEDLEGKLRSEDAWRILGRPSGQRTQDDNQRLGDALRRLGFDRKKLRFGGPNPEWGYARGDGAVRLFVEVGNDGVAHACPEEPGRSSGGVPW